MKEIKTGDGKTFPANKKGMKDAVDYLGSSGGEIYLPKGTFFMIPKGINNISVIGAKKCQ